jgi:thiol-disulfide isomerase/thioredoxin
VYSPTAVSAETWIGRLSVGIAVACATAVTVTAVALAMPSVRSTFGLGPAAPKRSYLAGQVMDLPPEIVQQAPHTVAIFFRPDCGACERLKPFLTRLAARSQNAVRVVAITSVANPADAQAFARQIGLDQSHLITMDLKGLRLTRVPPVVVLDRAGTIQTAVEGLPSSQEEEDLIRIVTALSQGR